MRKNLSIFMLAVRFTIYKVMGLLAVMSGVQTGLFLWAMKRRPGETLTMLLRESLVVWTAAAGFIVLCVLLCRRGKNSGGVKSVYTMRRLSVSEVTVTAWQAVQNSLMCLMFWLWEALTVLGLCLIYVNRAPEASFGPQTVFLTWYKMDFLHRLIPLADISGWVRNGVLVLGTGICSAIYSYHERRGSGDAAIWAMAVVVFAGFADRINDGNIADVKVILWGLIVTGAAVGVMIYRELHPEKKGKG